MPGLCVTQSVPLSPTVTTRNCLLCATSQDTVVLQAMRRWCAEWGTTQVHSHPFGTLWAHCLLHNNSQEPAYKRQGHVVTCGHNGTHWLTYRAGTVGTWEKVSVLCGQGKPHDRVWRCCYMIVKSLGINSLPEGFPPLAKVLSQVSLQTCEEDPHAFCLQGTHKLPTSDASPTLVT